MVKKIKFSFLPIPEEIMLDDSLSFKAKLLFGIIAKTNLENVKFSVNHLAKRIKCKERYTRQVIKELEEKQLITVNREKGRASRYTINFVIVQEIQTSDEKDTPVIKNTPAVVVQDTPAVVVQDNNKDISNKDIYINNISVASPSASPRASTELNSLKEKEGEEEWDWSVVLESMFKHRRRDMQIIALYWKFKGINYENKKQFEAGLKRELRPAQNLLGYSDERITEVMEFLSYDSAVKFTLETVHKYIDEDLSALEPLKVKEKKYY